MSEPQLVTVPRDLYYHEVAYVRGLEKEIARLRAAIEHAVEGMNGSVNLKLVSDHLLEALRQQ